MNALRAELCTIVADARSRGIALVAVGAFAVRAYLRDPDRRKTHDLDIVAPSEALPALRALLVERGYRVYESSPWWRAERDAAEGRILIDICMGAVVDVASFESYPIHAGDARELAEPGAVPIPVPRLEDLLAMKLLAHRDKDMLDVIALLRDAGDQIDATAFWRRVEDRDLEIVVRRGYLSVVAAANSGELRWLWEIRAGSPPSDEMLENALAQLHTLFR